MARFTLTSATAAINSTLVELGVVVGAIHVVKAFSTPCTLMSQWGYVLLLTGMGFALSSDIIRRAIENHPERAARLAGQGRFMTYAATPLLLSGSACLALSFVT